MNSKNKLIIGRGIFLIIVIVAMGLIVLQEKGNPIFQKKAAQEIEKHLQENYQEISNCIKKEEIEFQNNAYQVKVISKENENLYFFIKYQGKKIKDTYQKDYEEGKTLLDYLNQKLEKEIANKAKIECKVKPITTLNKYSEQVQERIIKEENLLELKYYRIEKDFIIKDWSKEEIAKEITQLIEEMKEKHITPKYYDFIITNANDITESIVIYNVTEDFLEEEAETIIEDILNKEENDYIKNNKIKIEYKNEEE